MTKLRAAARISATTSLAVGLAAGTALAGGIDRSSQSMSPLFETGTYAELSFGYVSPSVSGKDVGGGGSSGNVAAGFVLPSLAFKQDINAKLSYAVILDQAFGSDVTYGAGSALLGGTYAKANTADLTGVLRYKFTNRISAFGGLRVENANGSIGLRGLAYGGASGYTVDLASNTAVGYLLGVAYEIPEYAFRVDLTYNSSIKHSFGTTETGVGFVGGPSANTDVKTPQSVNFDFQTGINKSTLVFGSVRWVKWSEFQVNPQQFYAVTGSGLVSLENTTTYTLGVGHKFTDTWSGAVSALYEPKGNSLVSPLAPTNGRYGLSLAAIYTKDNMKITTGINYTVLGNAQAATNGTARSDFSGNHLVGVGMKIGWYF